tara:strand:+ start:62 stop:508 length:447 start_codon:yes stop_codon:yes gene_type:complete
MIRLATQEDCLEIARLIQEYVQTMDVHHAKTSFSLRATTNLVFHCIKQGLAWVSEKDGKIVGSLFAQEQVNPFTDSSKEIHLVGFFVKPEHRKGTMGGRLLIAYDKECKSREDVKISWVGLQHTAEINKNSLEKLGYTLSELTYKKEK